MFYSYEIMFITGLLLPAIIVASTIYPKEYELTSSEEATKPSEEEDSLQSVQTHVREKGDVFSKKDSLSDSKSASKSTESEEDYHKSSESFNNYNPLKINLFNSRYKDDRDYYDSDRLPSKLKKSLDSVRTTSEKSTSKESQETLKFSKQNLENQLKGQKEIAEPIMFRNRSDSHPTTRKPPPALLTKFLTQNHLPIYNIPYEEVKKGYAMPNSGLTQFQDEAPEAPPYGFRREISQDGINSDETYDNILDPKNVVESPYDDQGQLKQGMDILDESTIRRYSDQISDEESEDSSNGNKNENDEESSSKESEDNDNVSSSSEITKPKISESIKNSLGRYHRVREVSEAAM